MVSETGLISTRFKDTTHFQGRVLFHQLKLVSKSAMYPELCPTKDSVYLMYTGPSSLKGKANIKKNLVSYVLCVKDST